MEIERFEDEKINLKCPDVSAKDEKYPWHLLRRTVLLLNVFLVFGVSVGIIGPTLLDLKDLVGATIGEISFILMLSSIGSLVGCFFTGFLLDKLPNYKYLVLAGTVMCMSCPLAAYPYCTDLVSIYTCAFLSGFGSGNVDTAGNVIILNIWEGRDSGPYMHAVHFTFGLGAFLAPLIARPFLFNEETPSSSHGELGLVTQNYTEGLRHTEFDSPWTIKALYPMISSYGVLTTLGCIYYFLQDRRSDTGQAQAGEKLTQHKTEKVDQKMKLIIVGLLGVFFFLYVGMEVAFGTFISVFAVQSDLKFSRPEGSDVTAVFWGTFAGMRGLAVVLAVVAKPVLVMWSSFSLCLLGSVILSVWADQSSLVLYLGTAVLGVGMASIFATGFLWTEQKISVTSKVSATFIICSSLGAKVFPVMVGNLVESWPMMLHYLSLAIVIGCVIIFSLASLIIRRSDEENIEQKIDGSPTRQEAIP